MTPKETVMHNLHKIQSSGFWLVIAIALGFYLGITWELNTLNNKFEETVKIGGMLFKGKVYEVKERLP